MGKLGESDEKGRLLGEVEQMLWGDLEIEMKKGDSGRGSTVSEGKQGVVVPLLRLI